MKREKPATNGAALPGLPFPLVAGDRAEYEPTGIYDAECRHLADFAGACRVIRALEASEADAEVGPMFRVQCLNGGARNGTEFDAYESELTK